MGMRQTYCNSIVCTDKHYLLLTMGTLVCRSGVPSGDTAPRGPGCPDGEEGGGEGGEGEYNHTILE